MINSNNPSKPKDNFQNESLLSLSKAIDDSMKCETLANDNPFPIDAFPQLFSDFIVDLKKSLKFPHDYTGTAILTAISCAVGTTVKLKVKESWCEYGSLYCCLVGNAGANKTHPVNHAFIPIRELDKARHEIYVKLHKEYLEYAKLNEKQKKETTPVQEPILEKSLLTNFTPEILTKRLYENPRGITVLSDELATFLEGMNNYSKTDQSSTYLSFWSNQQTSIDRIGSPIPLLINLPYLSIIGGIQPRMLSKLFPVQKQNNGFYQRFLFAFPETTFKEPISDEESSLVLQEKYTDFINNNFDVKKELKADARILIWSKEAKDFFMQWNSQQCELVNDNQDTIRGEIISKFDIHFIRLALLLQMMENPESTEIGMNAVYGAEKLCNYYLNCTLKVLRHIQNPNSYLFSIADNKKQLYNSLPSIFTTAQAVDMGVQFDFQERRVKEFLKDEVLFKKIKHGTYERRLMDKKEE
nr:DUF3987 domain-containing protein [uncultured Flavobacterium sp.]